MNRKINTICFIFLFLFLISAVSAVDCENETQTISKNIAAEDTDTNSNPILQSSDEDEDIDANNNQILQAGNIESNKQPQSKQKVSIKAPDVTMYYNDGHKLTVTLTDSSKKPIGNAQLKVNMNGKTYTTATNKNGVGVLGLHLKSRTYSATITFDGSGIYEKASTTCTVTIKSTIKCADFTKYYKNNCAYSATFYDAKGNVLKNTPVKFQINSKIYSSKTDGNGVAKLNINMKPGKFSITSINPKTGEQITKSLTVKSLIETKDLEMTENDGSAFYVKILDSNGKASPNKKITLKVYGKTYTPSTDKSGQVKLVIKLKPGEYSITTEYDDLKLSNVITVNKAIKTSTFKHITSIPNYVNVTLPYVYPNAKYSIKTGSNGIVKMPKVEVFTVEIGSKTYQFSTGKTGIGDSVVMGEKSYLVPLNGGAVTCSSNKNSLTGNGIMITRTSESTEIEYRSKTGDNVELFGFYADKSSENSEIFTYMQNEKIMAKVYVQTQYFDETCVKYSLAKHYKRANTDFAYYEITNHVSNPVKFTNTGKAVTYTYFGRSIAGYASKEEITTKFIINGKEEVERKETISYGLGENYRKAFGFEVLQAYSIIAERVTQKTLENWVSYNPKYLDRFGVMNVYGMHLASLEATWLCDELADEYANEFNVSWERCNVLTILGGINLEDTYLNILNADMGMNVKGNKNNAVLFRLANSINLPNIEEYVLKPVSERYMGKTVNSQDNVFSSMKKNEFSMTQLGDLLYVFSKDDSAIVLNCTSGVASVIQYKNGEVYKGSSIATSKDCCSVTILPKDMISSIKTAIQIFVPGIYELTDELNNIHPFSVLAYIGIKYLLEHTLSGASSASLGLISAMTLIQSGGTMYRNNMVNEKEWHKTMDTITFTRPGYLQGKKVYNIPSKKMGYDYIEVKINNDLTLDRNSAIYISNGKTKRLTKKETYQYFSEDYWTPFSVPTKYWDESWKVMK